MGWFSRGRTRTADRRLSFAGNESATSRRARALFSAAIIESLEARVVLSTASTTTIAAVPNPSQFGASVNLTATVIATPPGTGTPTGTVTFKDGTTTLGTAILNSLGIGNFFTPAQQLAVGSHALTANYATDGTFDSSASTPLTQVVITDTTTTTLVFTPASPTYGIPVVFTATVTAGNLGAGTPTGTVTFLDGTTTLGTGTLDATGKATFTTTATQLGAATHSITASYPATTNFATSTSSASSVVVGQAVTTTTLTSTDTSSLFGAPETFTATVATSTTAAGAPAGTVTFLDGTTALGTGTLDSSGKTTFTTSSLSVGSHPISATYGSTTNFATSTSTALTHLVTRTPTTIHLSTSAGGLLLGQSLTLTATVAPSISETTLPSGSVTFLDGTTTLGTGTLSGGKATLTVSTLAMGHHNLTVSYPGDTNFLAATGTNTAPVAIGTANQLYVNQLYLDLLGRSPETAGLDYWTSMLDKGMSRTRVALRIELSKEFVLDTLDSMSQSLLGTSPTQAQINGALKLQSKSEAGPGQLEYLLLSSSDYYTKAGGTNSTFVTALGNEATAGGFTTARQAAYEAALADGTLRSTVVLSALRSTDGLTNRVDQTYQTYLDRTSDPAGQAFFVKQLRNKVLAVMVTAEVLGSEEFFSTNTTPPPATS